LPVIVHPNIEIMSRVTELSESEFDTVLQSEVPVLVDFWAPSCAPCRARAPILEALAEENEGEVTFVKVNAAQYPALSSQFGIDALPTLLFFNSGKVVERMVGLQSKHKIQSALDEIE
jgi:thioredoxin